MCNAGFQVVDNIGIVPTFPSILLIKIVIRWLFVVISLLQPLGQRFSTRGVFGSPGGMRQYLGTFFGCHHWGGVLWHLVG